VDKLDNYERFGLDIRSQILELLPRGWSFQGKRVLDFGCGAGRTLRHFLDEATEAEIWGCDIDAPSLEWLQANLCPPLRVFPSRERPPLPRHDGEFDLIWAVSVFTHLSDRWAEWLLELRRMLRNDGLLIATYVGEGVSERLAGEPWDADRIGMNVLRHWQRWDNGGPYVLHSDWWVRAHWGRAFEIVALERDPSLFAEMGAHTWVVMRKRPGAPTVDELERIDPGDPRELEAVRHNVVQLQRELEQVHSEMDGVDREELIALEADNARLHGELERQAAGYEASLSWKLTSPVRVVKRLIGRSE
jgi:SAM-dependent methyltransferase